MDTRYENLQLGWKFHYGEEEESWYKGFDDSSWEPVTIPHDWSVTLPFSKEYSSGTGYLAGGIGWYRVRFKLPEAYRGRKIAVCFDGIYKNSQVWCNSYYLGMRPNGYISYSYDITPFVAFGDTDNEISVKVTHTDLADSRWFTGSGITRKVTLRIEEPVHQTEYGIYMTTLHATSSEAQVECYHELINDTAKPLHLFLHSFLQDQKGNTVFSLNAEADLGAGEQKEIRLDTSVKAPELWSPDSPSLYHLITELKTGDHAFYRISNLVVGICTTSFDPDKGFFLNGKNTIIKGVCIHHDGGVLGAAMYRGIWQRRLSKLKEMGCNAIRCSHNPHMPELYDLCDQMGFLMMDEAFDEWENPKNKWSTGHNVYPPKHQGYYEAFPMWHETDLTAMVKRDRHHPSIILWSIGNEIDYPNDPYCHPLFCEMTGNNDANKPASEKMYQADRPNAKRLAVIAARLSSIVAKSDTSRPVTVAAAFPELSSKIGFFDTLTVIGYNYKEQFYEADHARFPKKSFLGSENSHAYEAWRAVTDHPYISGQFLWTGIDYLGEAYGWPIHGSAAGLLTLAGFEKPEYYKRQALWSESPVIHLATSLMDENTEYSLDHPEWKPMYEKWQYVKGDKITIRAYTNLPSAELFVNGNSFGKETVKNDFGIFEWICPYETGTVCVRGYDKSGFVCAAHELSTNGVPAALRLRLWEPADLLSKAPSDVYQIEAFLTDIENLPVTTFDQVINVTVTGGGKLLGIENGDSSDNTPYSATSRSTYQGKAIIYIRRDLNSPIKLIVHSEALTNELDLH